MENLEPLWSKLLDACTSCIIGTVTFFPLLFILLLFSVTFFLLLFPLLFSCYFLSCNRTEQGRKIESISCDTNYHLFTWLYLIIIVLTYLSLLFNYWMCMHYPIKNWIIVWNVYFVYTKRAIRGICSLSEGIRLWQEVIETLIGHRYVSKYVAIEMPYICTKGRNVLLLNIPQNYIFWFNVPFTVLQYLLTLNGTRLICYLLVWPCRGSNPGLPHPERTL